MTDSETETPDPSERACSQKVVEAGGKRRKRCPQPVVFRWQAFERPLPRATPAQLAATAAKPPASEGYACTMHRETAYLPDSPSVFGRERDEASWRGKFRVRITFADAAS